MKMKKFQVILAVLVCLSVLFTNSAFAMPAESENAELRYVTCPEGGKHSMTGRGRGRVYAGAPGSAIALDGFASQCDKCYLTLITQNNMFNNLPGILKIPGKYSINSAQGYIPTGWVEHYYGLSGTCNVPYLQDSFFAGFEFVS
jgi:hypothetical protein